MSTEWVEVRGCNWLHEAQWPGGPKETTAYLGRPIVALASGARVIETSGQLVEVGTLAREYGLTDIDGTQPPPFRSLPST